MSTISPKAAMYDLMGVICPCGAGKDRRRPFCLACFQRVPRTIRGKLAGAGKSESLPGGYVETYASALVALGLESPFLKAGNKGIFNAGSPEMHQQPLVPCAASSEIAEAQRGNR